MIIFLVGYYYANNVGDDICLQQSQAILKSAYPDASFQILASPSLPRFSWFKLCSVISRCDRVVFGGGSLLQDSTSRSSLLYYLLIILMARIFRVPLYLLSQGFGPISSSFLKYLTLNLLKGARYISVRDVHSQNELGSIKSTLSADLAFYGLPADLQLSNEQAAVGLALCDYTYLSEHRSVLSLLGAQKKNLHFFSFFNPEDYDLLRALNISDDKITVVDSETYYLKSDDELSLLIAMRYHSCVWAAIRGVPFIALAYDPKVYAIACELGQPVIKLYDNEFTIEMFESLLYELHGSYNDYRSRLCAGVLQLKDRLNGSMDYV